jgi:hypothetical protein
VEATCTSTSRAKRGVSVAPIEGESTREAELGFERTSETEVGSGRQE